MYMQGESEHRLESCTTISDGPESGKERNPRLEYKIIPIKHNTYSEEGGKEETEMGHGKKVCADI